MTYYDKNIPEIYHVCKNCPDGSAIAEADRKEGCQLGASRCSKCDNLKLTNGCTTEGAK